MTVHQTNEKLSFLQQLDSQLICIALTEKDNYKKKQALQLSRRVLRLIVRLMAVKFELSGKRN